MFAHAFGAGVLNHQHILELLVDHDYKTTHKQVNKQTDIQCLRDSPVTKVLTLQA